MSQELTQFSEKMIPAVEQEMKAVLQCGAEEDNALFGMMHYHMGWADAQFEAADAPAGKRIRPLLLLLIAAAAGGDWQQAVPAGAAVELLHNFTLVHDDIQDASPTRRGRETVWKIWGAPQAINVGDAMFALSHEALYRLADRKVPAGDTVRAARRFDETCVALTQGQYHDMAFEERAQVSVDEYLAMIGGKTAALLTLCGDLGALVAGQGADVAGHYAAFARDLGMAFQVKDDILGIWGDETRIGKSAATDIVTRKKTLPVLYGLAQNESLRTLYSRPEPETDEDFVTEVVRLLDESGARTYARQEAERYSDSALAHLEAAGPTGMAADALRQLAGRLLQRDA